MKKKIYSISIFEHLTSSDRKLNPLAKLFKAFDLKFSDYLWLFTQMADGTPRREYWKE